MFELMPWLLGFAVIGLGWWQALGARTRARRAALAACEQAEVTFIDELAFERVGWRRGGLWRRYRFEFYQRGDRRYRGTVEMRGLHVLRVQLDAHPFTEPEG